jgi:predicted tellurium resistance membrane protein TerC
MEGSGMHIDKTYVYFAMAFAGIIELLNSKVKMRPTRKLTRKKSEKKETANTKLVVESMQE